MGTHAVVTALSVALGCWASVASLDATGVRSRTPAEIERRRDEIALRLAIIEQEATAIATWCAEPPERQPLPDDPVSATIDRQRQECPARLAALADETATLERERAVLAAVRTRNATGPLQPADPQGVTPLDLTGQSGQVTAGQSFNPAMSVVPDIAYYNDNRQGQAVEGLERGFNLREVELAFSGSVDPYFDVWATFAVDADGIDSEEVYVQTRKFLPGVQLRVGKFFSGIGYINKQHPHQWDFVDQALPYEALLGGNLGEVGLQATWLPNLPVYTLLGFEALQGDNTRVSQQLSDAYPDTFGETPGPRLFTGFMKVAPDVGYSNAVQGGVSFGRSRSHQEAFTTGEGLLDEALDGTAWFAGTDWVWRHDSPRAVRDEETSPCRASTSTAAGIWPPFHSASRRSPEVCRSPRRRMVSTRRSRMASRRGGRSVGVWTSSG